MFIPVFKAHAVRCVRVTIDYHPFLVRKVLQIMFTCTTIACFSRLSIGEVSTGESKIKICELLLCFLLTTDNKNYELQMTQGNKFSRGYLCLISLVQVLHLIGQHHLLLWSPAQSTQTAFETNYDEKFMLRGWSFFGRQCYYLPSRLTKLSSQVSKPFSVR